MQNANRDADLLFSAMYMRVHDPVFKLLLLIFGYAVRIIVHSLHRSSFENIGGYENERPFRLPGGKMVVNYLSS